MGKIEQLKKVVTATGVRRTVIFRTNCTYHIINNLCKNPAGDSERSET